MRRKMKCHAIGSSLFCSLVHAYTVEDSYFCGCYRLGQVLYHVATLTTNDFSIQPALTFFDYTSILSAKAGLLQQ